MNKMNKITAIKTNGFVDVIESSIEISKDFLDIENIEDILYNHDNGIFTITHIKLHRDSGQMGDYGQWEIEPYVCIEDCKIKKISDLYTYVTNSEKDYKKRIKSEKMVKNLLKYVQSFSDENIQYQLCKIWTNDKLALREVSGNMFKTIHQFEDDSTSTQNIGKIRKWVDNYFNVHKGNLIEV